MKKLITSLVFISSLLVVQTHAYTFGDLKTDFVKDTKEVFMKNVKTGYFYDFLEKDGLNRHKFGVSTPLVAYKFLAVEPIAIFTPSSADAIAEAGFAFPIRIGYIPIGSGLLIKDLQAIKEKENNILDRLYLCFY